MNGSSLESLDSAGNPPVLRVSTPEAAYAIYQDLLNADLQASRNRAAVDAMFNGEPPWDQEVLNESGRGDDCNVNWQQAFALLENALSTYYDLINSVERLVKVRCDYGAPEKRPILNRNIEEAFTNLLRSWPEFEYWFQNICLQFVKHGVSFAFFQDEIDFRFRSCGMADFKLPRNTPAVESALEVACCCVPMTISELYKLIEDEETATEQGWDVDQAKSIIIDASNSFTNGNAYNWQNWEFLANQIKENDLYYSSGRASQVWVVHEWVKEFDQTITHLMFPRDGKYSKFLYKNPSRFENISQAFTVFTYGIGTGTYHSVRGLGYRIQAIIQSLNMLQCKAADGAMDATAVMIQPTDANNSDMERLAIGHFGGLTTLPPGVKFVERPIPDFSRSVLPVFQQLVNQLRTNTTSFQGVPMQRDGSGYSVQPTPVFQQKLEAEISSSLSASAVDAFYKPLGRLLKEVFRRATSIDYSPGDPGWELIAAFRKELKEKGVPLEALGQVKDVKPVRAIGAGSPAARMMALNEAMTFAGSMDEEGRYNLIRDFLAERLGADNINRYLPEFDYSKQRIPQDAVNAELENFMIKMGTPPQFVRPNDNHFVHASMHLSQLFEAMEGFRNAESEPQIQEVAQLFGLLQVSIQHIGQHMQLLGNDQHRRDQTKMLQQQFQQVQAAGERIGNQLKAMVENEQARQQAELEAQQQAHIRRYQELEAQAAEAQQGGDPKTMAKIQAMMVEAATKMKIAEMEAQQKARARQVEMMQKLAFKDAENRANIIGKSTLQTPTLEEMS